MEAEREEDREIGRQGEMEDRERGRQGERKTER